MTDRDVANVRVESWRLRVANAHLLFGRRPVLVDTGPASMRRHLDRRLRRAGVEPAGLGAVVLTHAHADHAGNAGMFDGLGVPVVLGDADAALAAAGHDPVLEPTGPAGRLLDRVLDHRFPGFVPSVTVTTTIDVATHGIDGEFRIIGGHTAGSGVLVTDGLIAVGDLIRGGYLGGAALSGVANVHYFSPDPATDLRSVAGLIDELQPRRVLVGHGGPLDADTARRRIEVLLARLEP